MSILIARDAAHHRGTLTWLGRIGVGVALAAIAALAASGAYYQIFSAFLTYDDEGLMMLSVRHVLDGHRLYDEVRVGYGPFYYVVKEIIHGSLGVPLTHDAVRLTATAFRLLAAAFAAGMLFGMTRHVTLAGIGFLLVTVHLVIVRNEPGHPQELAAVVLMATPLVALGMRARRATAIVACLGFLVAGMTMIKSNLGVFTGLAVWMAVLSSMPASRLRLVMWVASAATATALPIVLMRPHLSEPWGAQLAGCAAAWIVAVSMLSTPRRGDGLQPRHLVVLAAAVAGGVALLLLPHVMSGTSVTTLVRSLVSGPHSLVALFVHPFLAPPQMVPAAVAGVALVALAAWTARAAGHRRGALHAIGLAQLAFAVLVVREVMWSRPAELIGLLAPFTWLVLVRGVDEKWSWEHRFVRLLLAWLAIIEPLQVYPRPGSQMWLGSLALVVCGVVCLGDAADWARALLPASVRRPARAIAATAMLGVTIMLAANWRDALEHEYRAREPLNLPGATRLRIRSRPAKLLRRLVETIDAHCNPFFTYPGFNSLYFWTGQVPPSLELVSHEIRLVAPERQDAIVEVLAQSPTACFVRQPGISELPSDPSFERRMAPLFGSGGAPRPNRIRVDQYQVLTRIPGPPAPP